MKRKSRSWAEAASEKCEVEKKYHPPPTGGGRPVNVVKEEDGGNMT